MKKAILLATDYFEELEAVTVIDVLRRAGIKCDLCSVENKDVITGSHGISMISDVKMKDIDEKYDAVILPGGLPGADMLRDNDEVISMIKKYDDDGSIVAAICAAPKVLERAGIINGKRVTSYPNCIANESNMNYTNGIFEHDKNIITGKAPGAAADFAFEIASELCGKETAEKVRHGMFF